MLTRTRTVIGCLALALLAAGPARADQWNERTVLRFSAPVMVPGATLAPGEYVFQIADTRADRHVIRIFSNDGDRRLITTTEAIPVKRAEVSDEVVVNLTPTEAGAPVAMSGWFYPGSRYGHRFIYPEEQARDIAARTRSLVLSRDTGDGQSGTIHVIDAQGQRSDWRGDTQTISEWEAWRQAHPNAESVATTSATPGNADVAVARTDRRGTQVKVDDLEDNPAKYIGERVSVDAEVEKVIGPRVFTIDEPDWADLQGEIIVVMPTTLAALVKEDDRVTVEGTVRPFSESTVKQQWGWMNVPAEIERKIGMRPVLMADRIVGGNDNRALIVRVNDNTQQPTGTAGAADAATSSRAAGADITDLREVARSGDELVGRNVHLTGVAVEQPSANGGFLIRSGDTRIFVLPALSPARPVTAGTSVALDGVILQMPRQMIDRLGASRVNDDVYIYALGIRQ